MKKIMALALASVFCLCLFHGQAAAKAHAPAKGDLLPDFNLSIPEKPSQKEYLGLSGGGSFRIPQISARMVIVEIFSMYCPYCQREAPEVNKLFELIQGNETLKDKVKLIGIGVGNSPFEVSVFRDKYGVLFPLFADQNFSIHKCLGEVRTPYFIVVRIDRDGTHEIIYSELGGIKDADSFLKSILKLSGLEKEEKR